MKRSAGIGFGTKFDFTKLNPNKAPFSNNKSDFAPDSKNSPRWTFGESREKFKKVFLEHDKNTDPLNPGPGNYHVIPVFGEDAKKFSISSRVQISNKSSQSPGPGAYKVTATNADGKYFDSRVRNSTSILFGLSKSKRDFVGVNNITPGPGAYKFDSLIDANGGRTNYNSKYRSPMAKSITGKIPDNSKDKNVPGPGQYTIFSEFGIYGSKK